MKRRALTSLLALLTALCLLGASPAPRTAEPVASVSPSPATTTSPTNTAKKPAKPAIPYVFCGGDMIAIQRPSNCATSMDGKTYIAQTIYMGLKPNTAYTVYMRVMATKTAPASDPVVFEITTANLDVARVQLPVTRTCYIGRRTSAGAIVAPSLAPLTGLNWTSSNPHVLGVDASGRLTGRRPGKSIVTAVGKVDPSVFDSCVVTVKPVLMTGLKLTSKSKVDVGGQINITASPQPADTTNKKLLWESSDTGVATVSEKGRVTGVAIGTAVIVATATDGTGVTARRTIAVAEVGETDDELVEDPDAPDEPPVKVTSISMKQVSLRKGLSTRLNVTFAPEDATDRTLTFNTSNNKVATVTDAGLLTAVDVGTATITAKSSNGKTATCKIEVLRSTRATTIQRAISFCYDQLDKPYVWGAKGAASYDCSGLLYRAYQYGGLPWGYQNSQTMYINAARKRSQFKVLDAVPKGRNTRTMNLNRFQPGDLLFFRTSDSRDYSYGITHVAIYVGGPGKRIIHASSGRNRMEIMPGEWFAKSWLYGYKGAMRLK